MYELQLVQNEIHSNMKLIQYTLKSVLDNRFEINLDIIKLIDSYFMHFNSISCLVSHRRDLFYFSIHGFSAIKLELT